MGKKLKNTLALLLCLSLFPAAGFAEGPEETSETEELEQAAYTMEEEQEESHEHSFTVVVTEPTCTEQGYTTYTCECGDSYVDDFTDALNHPEFIDVPEVPVTENGLGATAGKKCAVCGEILEGCEEIPVLEEVVTDSDAQPEADSLVIEEAETIEMLPADSGTTVVQNGTCGAQGDNLTWVLYDNGELVIDGFGDMENYEVDPDPNSLLCSHPWNGYKIQSVIINSGVTSIGKCAFWNCISLKSVTISESVTKIGALAFNACNLTDVTIPGNVTSIDRSAFAYCSSLTSATILSGVNSIGEAVFYGCNALKNMSIPDTVSNIGVAAFGACNNLSDVYYDGVQAQWNQIRIGGYNEALSSAIIHFEAEPAAVDSGTCGTQGDNLTWVLYDNGELKIKGAGGMANFRYDTQPWNKYKLSIISITIEDEITAIGDCAFWGCRSLKSASIPKSITDVGNCAFRDCSSLENIVIHEGVAVIGGDAFIGCSSLTNVLLPASLKSLGGFPFADCSCLSAITVNPENPVYCDVDGVLFTKNLKILWQYPAARNGSYIIPDSVTHICNGAFYGCGNLTDITIPNTVTSIEKSTFWGCIGLTSILLPDSINSIGDRAFNSCSNLTTIRFLGTPPTISDDAFTGVTANAYYPANKGWTAADLQNYGGELSWMEDLVKSFVIRAYRLILDREADEEGLDFYTERLQSRQLSGAQLVSSFMNSPEFTDKKVSNEETVSILYRVMMDREPDPDGLAYHKANLDRGLSYNYVINNFSGSAEFGDICAKSGITPGTVGLEWRDQNPLVTDFVNRNYLYALERKGEGDGLNYYCQILLEKTLTPQQVAHGFVFSPECVNRGLSDRDFIAMLYHLYMGREADEGGMNYYLNALSSGTTRETVEAGFAASPEFADIVASYGL